MSSLNPPPPSHRPSSPELSPRQAFQVFRSEVQPTQNLWASTDLSPRPDRQPVDFSTPLRVTVEPLCGSKRWGRLAQASVTGLRVRCKRPLPARATAVVQWTACGGHTMAFGGHVARSAGGEMLVRFELESREADFLQSFIELSRWGREQPPEVRIQEVKSDDPALDRAAIHRELEGSWQGVEASIRSDEAHQRFIQACVRLKHTPFALERYRELANRPDPEHSGLAKKYLEQLGTILSFSGGMEGRVEVAPSPLAQKWVWGLLLAGTLLAVAGAHRWVRAGLEAAPPPISSVPTEPIER